MMFDSNQLTNYFKVVKQLRSFVLDPEYFKLKLLLALTLPQESGEVTTNHLSGLHFTYLRLLRRRLEWKYSQQGHRPSAESLDENIAIFIKGILDLKPMTSIFQFVLKNNCKTEPKTP